LWKQQRGRRRRDSPKGKDKASSIRGIWLRGGSAEKKNFCVSRKGERKEGILEGNGSSGRENRKGGLYFHQQRKRKKPLRKKRGKGNRCNAIRGEGVEPEESWWVSSVVEKKSKKKRRFESWYTRKRSSQSGRGEGGKVRLSKVLKSQGPTRLEQGGEKESPTDPPTDGGVLKRIQSILFRRS